MTDTESQTIWTDCSLEDGIRRGDDIIRTIRLRQPRAGELRGLNLQALMRLDIASLVALLPRITDPSLLQSEIEDMTPVDIGIVGEQVLGFFMTSQQRKAVGLA